MTTSRLVRFGLLVAVGLILLIAPILASASFFDLVFETVSFGIYASIGGLIIARHDGHLSGWLLTLVGLMVAFIAAVTYLVEPSAFLALWVASWGWTAVFALFAALTLTFPAGHVPRGRGPWARAARAAVWLLPVLVVASTLTETLGGSEMLNETPNPFGFLPDWVGTASLFGVVFILLCSVVSVVLKRRRSSGAERAQLTWVVFGLVLLVTAIVLTFMFIAISIAVGAGDPGDDAWLVAYVVMISFPVTFGVAILRYRLYDIDRIISRTISYLLVGGLLAVVFFTTVTAVGSLIQTDSDLVIAASTLAVAALFNPVRKRIQSGVDRRFNRSRFDAQRVMDRFAGSLQDRTDGGAIVEGWVGVVSETMQPSLVAVWVRDGNEGRGFGAPIVIGPPSTSVVSETVQPASVAAWVRRR